MTGAWYKIALPCFYPGYQGAHHADSENIDYTFAAQNPDFKIGAHGAAQY